MKITPLLNSLSRLVRGGNFSIGGCLLLSSFILHPSSLLQAQYPVTDAGLIATTQANHAETLAKWVENINKATEQVNKLNDVISNLDNVQGLIGKGMDSIGIDPSILQTIELAKSLNNFGSALQGLQHNAGNIPSELDNMRQETSDPNAWLRYATVTKSYNATQKAQTDYDTQMAKLKTARQQAEAQLKAAKSLGETAKAQAALDSIDAAMKQLAEERKRAFEQQQANHIENQNQKDAWEQSTRDWTAQELQIVGGGLDQIMQPNSPNKK